MPLYRGFFGEKILTDLGKKTMQNYGGGLGKLVLSLTLAP
jgi:hypothetical protein